MTATRDPKLHWQATYAGKPADEVSWFEAVPSGSLELIEAAGAAREAPVIDVGGGASALAGELLERGFEDVTVCDVAPAALEEARRALGQRADAVTWVEADVRELDLGRTFDLWHDRAVFHFMVNAADRAAYRQAMLRSLRPGGHAIVATFGPDGPTRCSGLPVRRYGQDDLVAELGPELVPLTSRIREHTTPSGATQQFHYGLLRRREHETVEGVLAEARAGLRRLSPADARAATASGAVLVDIRADHQRERDGLIPGALHIPRNVLEWRCDPSSPHRDDTVARRDRPIVLICDEGYQSSLAAATLRRFGVDATDVVGGFRAWRGEGHPVSPDRDR